MAISLAHWARKLLHPLGRHPRKSIKKKQGWVYVIFTALALVVSGCSSLGPSAMKGERVLFNAALQQTNDEQLLLNLVRLRYQDTPAFLQVSSISSQLSLEVGVTGGVELERSTANTNLFSFGGATAYSTRPTLSYTPLQGSQFIQQMLMPLTIEKILLLYRSGWNTKRLFTVCVQRINSIRNAPRASGPTPGRAPDFVDFSLVITLLRKLERQGFVDIGYETHGAGGKSTHIVLYIDPRANGLPETQKFRQMLQLSPKQNHYPLIYNQIQPAQAKARDFIELDTRSLLGVMYFLSNAVQVPEDDVRKGRVKTTQTKSGQAFNWAIVLGKYLRINVSDTEPIDTRLRVNFRGRWYYVDDSDLESKSTFTLLAQIYALQAGKSEGIVPVLTLPVGR